MRDFDFLKPASLREACQMLEALGDECRIAAGCSALLLGMRQGMLSPTALVSLSSIAGLDSIHFDPQKGLRIGAMARHADIARSAVVKQHYPVLASMAARMANPQVRNQGTLGGNLAYGDPSTDPPGCLLAHGASVVVHGLGGEHRMPMQDFLVDYFTTALESTDILVAIEVPPPDAAAIGVYWRHLRTAAEHRPLVNVTFLCDRDREVCRNPRLVVGASVPVAQRIRRAEEHLEGKVLTLEVAAEAAALVTEEIEPISDLRGDGAYRRHVTGVVAKRAISQTWGLNWMEAEA